MQNSNKNSTRYYSDAHEKSVCKALNASQQPNSGAGHFNKGDVVHKEASMMIECKCTMSPKDSISLKKEWFTQNKQEAYAMHLSNTAVCINFEPGGENIYCINERLMKVLINALSSESQCLPNDLKNHDNIKEESNIDDILGKLRGH